MEPIGYFWSKPKPMRKTILMVLATVALSCHSKTDKNGLADGQTTETTEENTELIAHPMLDNKNQVMAHMTLPANWKLHNEPGKAAFTGPNGIFVYNIPIRNFMFTNDAMTAEIYRQNGGKLRAPVSAEDLVHQDLEPVAKSEGSKLIKIYRNPEIAQSDGSIQDMMYHIGASSSRYDAVVSEWEDKDGNPYAIVLHSSVTDMGNMVMWNYYGHGIDAPKAHYESAKKTLLSGLASLKYNPRYFDQYNQNEQHRESASWAAHHQRMSAQQQQFDAQQQAFKEKSEAINSSIMASYNERNASSDRMHNRFVNYIKDENTVVNPGDGKRYQVQTGSNQYYMNSNGQYIGTNDPNYNPNRDPNVNNQDWNQTEITD